MSIFKFVANEMECMHDPLPLSFTLFPAPHLLSTYVMCSFVRIYPPT